MLSLSSHSGSHNVSLGGGETSSVFNPYNTSSLHIFIKEVFPGALLLEEHQVCIVNFVCTSSTVTLIGFSVDQLY